MILTRFGGRLYTIDFGVDSAKQENRRTFQRFCTEGWTKTPCARTYERVERAGAVCYDRSFDFASGSGLGMLPVCILTVLLKQIFELKRAYYETVGVGRLREMLRGVTR